MPKVKEYAGRIQLETAKTIYRLRKQYLEAIISRISSVMLHCHKLLLKGVEAVNTTTTVYFKRICSKNQLTNLIFFALL